MQIAAGLGDDYPLEWNKVIRPIIAKLYKEAIITTSYSRISTGQAIAAREPSRSVHDLYFDWRHIHPGLPARLQDPTAVEPFLSRARAFSASCSVPTDARFSYLKIYSPPHFYPLMNGIDKRGDTSFVDGLGRCWEWKFVPKDMPYSEWSIHHTANLRIAPYRQQFGDRVHVRRDAYLVMAESREELFKLVIGVCFAVTTRPWRWEVDLWKSFVDVDLDFVKKLDERGWLD